MHVITFSSSETIFLDKFRKLRNSIFYQWFTSGNRRHFCREGGAEEKLKSKKQKKSIGSPLKFRQTQLLFDYSLFMYVYISKKQKILGPDSTPIDPLDFAVERFSAYGINGVVFISDSVATGTYGIATLPDKDGVQQKLFRHIDGPEKEYLCRNCFGKLYIVINRLTTLHHLNGQQLIGVNNPPFKNDILCKDICSNLKWFMIKKRTDIKRGLYYVLLRLGPISEGYWF